MHRFFRTDRLSCPQDPVRPADAVVQVFVALFDEELACLPFVVDDDRHDVANLPEQFRFGPPKRHLIADLVEIAHRLRAFAIEPADREADLLQAAKDLVDLPRDDQGRQMQHHADPHAGAHVRRAGGQIPQPIVECVGDLLFDQIVDPVHLIPNRLPGPVRSPSLECGDDPPR